MSADVTFPDQLAGVPVTAGLFLGLCVLLLAAAAFSLLWLVFACPGQRARKASELRVAGVMSRRERRQWRRIERDLKAEAASSADFVLENIREDGTGAGT